MTSARVLIVEDDEAIGRGLETVLVERGFAVQRCLRGGPALVAVDAERPDLVLLDLGLPGIDGFEVLRQIRAFAPTLPVVVVSAHGDDTSKVRALDQGADDYVSKPFSPRELAARVKAVLRRAAGAGPVISVEGGVDRLVAGDLQIDVSAREARRGQEVMTLTAREFDLIVFLASRPRRAFRREELLEEVWGYTYGDTATVTVHVRRIREKIEADPGKPRHLVTVWGVGYRWDP